MNTLNKVLLETPVIVYVHAWQIVFQSVPTFFEQPSANILNCIYIPDI